MKYIQTIHPALFVLIAALLEAGGDALLRKCMYEYSGSIRVVSVIISTVLLFGYGFFLNLAPVTFGQVVGLYIAILFIVFQVVNYVAFHALPTLPVVVGGLFVVSGGLIITFWRR